MTEIWRDVPGFQGEYQVSSAGRVRSLERRIVRRNGSPYSVHTRILSPGHRQGFVYVTLADERRSRRVNVAKLVEEVFGDHNERTAA